MITDVRANRKFQIFTAFSSFTPNLTKRLLTLDANTTADPNRVTQLLAISPVTGVNAIFTTQSEGTPVIGTKYQFAVSTTLAGASQPFVYNFNAIATTTSFTDLADLFVAQINARAATGISPFPGIAVNSGGHLRITEVPPSSYGAGEMELVFTAMTDPTTATVLVTAANFNPGTAHTNPVGQYAALQRLYLANTNNGIDETNWLNGAPVSTSTYLTVIASYQPVQTPFNGTASTITWISYYDASAISAARIAYIKGTVNNFGGQLGLQVGDNVPVIPIVTTAANEGVIPSGASMVYVASASSGYFVALPASYPVGKPISIFNNGTGYKLIMGASETINGGSAGVGSSAIPASVNLTAVKSTTIDWLVTAQLESGTGVATAVPANS